MEQNKEPKVAIIGSGSTGTNAMLHAALAELDAADVIVIDEPTRAEEMVIEPLRYIRMPHVGHAPLREWQQPYKRSEPKIGRNAPCPCGSGLKYKRCCAAPK